MDALRSPSALSHAEAAHDAERDALAASAEVHGDMLKGATFPYWRNTVWLLFAFRGEFQE